VDDDSAGGSTLEPAVQRLELIRLIHDAPGLAVLAVTGGGVAAIVDLLSVPGASRTVLEVVVPYAEAALTDLLGERPGQATSVETAADMARACRRRATRLAPDGADRPLFGLACTAALATDRPKRGEHRAHVGLDDGAGVRVWTLTLAKGARDRQAEDRLVSDTLVAVLGEACGVLGVGGELVAPGETGTAPIAPVEAGGEPVRALLRARLLPGDRLSPPSD
jgi:hypothetical protein